MEKVFYIADLLDKLQPLLTILGVGGLVFFVFVFLWAKCGVGCDTDKECKSALRGSFVLLAIGVIAMSLHIALPSKRTYLFMQIGSIVDTAVENNPNLKQIPENAMIIFNKYIEDELEKETKPHY